MDRKACPKKSKANLTPTRGISGKKALPSIWIKTPYTLGEEVLV